MDPKRDKSYRFSFELIGHFASDPCASYLRGEKNAVTGDLNFSPPLPICKGILLIIGKNYSHLACSCLPTLKKLSQSHIFSSKKNLEGLEGFHLFLAEYLLA